MLRNRNVGMGRILLAASLVAGSSALFSCDATQLTDIAPHPEISARGPRFVVNTGEYVKFYIHAHQDDWQLFMGDRTSAGLQTVPNIVFVYATAGDGGQSAAYWQTRELAAQTAVDSLVGPGPWSCAPQTINTHGIRRCVKGRAVVYDMRLPDGATTGDGFSGHGSLSQLRDGQISRLAALDASTTYTSWTDLYTTIRAIVDYESGNQSAPFVEVHAPEYDRTTNSGDHTDHLATADAVHAVAGTRAWNLAWYIDYRTQFLPINLTQAQHDVKQRLFYAYDNVMGAAGYGRNRYETEYQAWLWRTYVRTEISTPAPPPATPSNLQAQATSASRISLAWTDNATNETGYTVERAPDNNGVAGTFASTATLPANAAGYVDSGLSGNTRYWYRVRAFNTTDVSSYSNQANTITLQAPAVPTNLQGLAISSTRIDLSWTDNATNETAYLVERAPDNAGVAGTFAQVASLGAGAITYSDNGLTANTRYWYRARAVNATDTSAYSAQASAATLQPPATPSNLQAQAISPTQINLTWTDNATDETGYTVERAPDNSGTPGTFSAVATLAANAVAYSDPSLSQNTRYWYRVRAFNAVDVSAYSAQASATTPQTPPAAPTNLQALAVSSSRIDLTWMDNATNETGYTVERAPDSGGTPGAYAAIATLGANVATYSNTGLTANTRYWYRVRAFNASSPSGYSADASATTLPPPPATPTNLQASAISASQIDLSWTDNATNETGYTVERAPDNAGVPGTFASIATLGANAVSYSNTGLASSTRYWYRVRAFNAVDVSAYSGQVSATTLVAPPAAPTNLVAQSISSSRIDLTWTDNATNETGFYVESAPDNAGSPGTFVQIASVGANVVSFSNTGLNASTRYWYRVRSYNSAQASAYSNSASATTQAPPTTRTDLYFHAHQDDWQLFMGDRVYRSVQVATKVVFVYATAGDGGQSASYWQTRELAAQVAVDALIGSGTWACAAQVINTHSIRRCVKGKAISYDMRLPDGATSGEGFGGRGSMSLLRDGGRSTLAALDGSTTYTSWSDLTTTMRAIVDFESGNQSAPYVEVHAPEYNRTTNPGDHADHTAVADGVRAASTTRSWGLSWYIDYNTQNLAINLTQAAHDIKQLSFYALDNYMGAAGYGRNQWESDYQAWLWRTYFRTGP